MKGHRGLGLEEGPGSRAGSARGARASLTISWLVTTLQSHQSRR